MRELLINKTASEKADLKGIEITRLVEKRTEKRGNLDIEIVDIEAIKGGVQVFARAYRDGKQLGFGKDGSIDIERFRIFNPPILVDDENGDIVQEWTDEFGVPNVRKLREDPKEALLRSLEHTISVMKNVHDGERIVKGKRGNTTSTFYPEPDPATDAGDGSISKSTTTWSGSRTGTGTAGSGGATLVSRADRVSSTDWRTSRAYTNFLTSVLGAGSTVSSATLTLVVGGNGVTAANQIRTVCIVEFQGSAPDGVGTEYEQVGNTLDNPTEGASRITLNNPTTTGTPITFTLNSNGLGWINKTGVTKLGIRDSLDVTNTAPTNDGNGRIQFYASERTGTSEDPKLVVEHEAPVTQNSAFLMFM